MQQLNLKGKILFVFSDPGGAKPILSLIENEKLNETLVVSDREYPFYKDFKSQVKILENEPEDIINSYKPNLIYTGTSYRSEIEKQFIQIANQKGITSISFIDHWTSMRNRFELPEGKLIFPSQIDVIDERAKQIAINEGIDKEKIVITGNPYHTWLKNWKPTISKEQFLQSIHSTISKKKIALFAPDPLSNVNGLKDFGFDEVSAIKELKELFKSQSQINDKWIFFIKTHPNQDLSKLDAEIKDDTNFYTLPSDVDVNSCIYYSDLVMGFFSSFLIEADIMKKKVLRYLPKQINDPIRELNIGQIVNKDTITNYLMKAKWN